MEFDHGLANGLYSVTLLTGPCETHISPYLHKLREPEDIVTLIS